MVIHPVVIHRVLEQDERTNKETIITVAMMMLVMLYISNVKLIDVEYRTLNCLMFDIRMSNVERQTNFSAVSNSYLVSFKESGHNFCKTVFSKRYYK